VRQGTRISGEGRMSFRDLRGLRASRASSHRSDPARRRGSRWRRGSAPSV